MDDSGAPSQLARGFTQELSIVNLRATQDFLAGSKCSYGKNIKTNFFGMK